MKVVFRCGHQADVNPDGKPTCACGERRIAQTIGVPAPRFRGHATGPHAEFVDLPAIPVTFKAPEATNG